MFFNGFYLTALTFLSDSKPGKDCSPPDTEIFRNLLIDNLKFIEGRCYKAYGLSAGWRGEEVSGANKADSLLVEVIDHLSADNYRVIREYKGKASLKRYLEVVICNKVIDLYRRKEGRGRAPEEARKMGEAGVRLHELVHVRGLPVEEAHTIMIRESVFTGGIETLREMAGRIGSRRVAAHREVPVGTLPFNGSDEDAMPGGISFRLLSERSADEAPGPEQEFFEKEKETRKSAVLKEIVQSLTPEERLMVGLKYVDGRSVREIARAIGCTEKNAYRKLAAMLEKCRKMLFKKGLKTEDLL